MPAVARFQSPDEAGDSSTKRIGDEMSRRKLTGLDEVHEEEESEFAESSFANERKVSCASESSRRSSIDINGKKKKSSDGGLFDSQWEHARRLSEAGVRRMSDASVILTEDTDSFIIGDRVWVGGTKPGQIAFIGETQFAPGEWAGVVLDEPVGKNDGSVAGIRYFQCESKRGVFSRLTRLTLKPLDQADGGIPEGKISSVNSSVKIQSTTMAPKESIKDTSMGKVSSPTSGSTSPGASNTNLRIGDRVIVSSSAGSKAGMLRYKGPTDFAAGEWCGVELDDAVGKNDGSVGDRRYFECRPKFGLFAPAHKVSASPSSRRTSSCMLHRSGIPGSNIRRAGSRESMTSVASSVTSSVRSARDPIKERDLEIERLIKAQQFDREELTRAATQAEEAEIKLAVLKQDHDELQEKTDARIKELEHKLAQAEQDKLNAIGLLEDEKKKAEDLVFQYEEANITMAEIKVVNSTLDETVRQLHQRLSEEQQKSESLEQEANKLFETEENLSRFKEELETLQNKLEVTQTELNLKNECLVQLQKTDEKIKLSEELQDAQKALEVSQVKCKELENSLNSENKELKKSLNSKHEELESLQSVFKTTEDSFKIKFEDLESRLKSKSELIDGIQSSLDNRNSEVQELKQTIEQIHLSLTMVCKSIGKEVSDVCEENRSDSVQKLIKIMEDHVKQKQIETKYDKELENSLKSENEELKKSLNSKHEELDSLQSVFKTTEDSFKIKFEDLESRLKSKSELIDSIQSSLDNRNFEVQELKQTIEQIHLSLTLVCKSIGKEVSDVCEENRSNSVQMLIKIMGDHIKQMETKYDTELATRNNLILQLEENVKDKNAEVTALRRTVDASRADSFTQTEQNQENQEKEIEARNSEVIHFKNISESLKKELQDKEISLKEKEDKIDGLKEELLNSDKTVTVLKQEAESLQFEIECVRRLVEIEEARCEMLLEQQRKMENTVSELMDLRSPTNLLISSVEEKVADLTATKELMKALDAQVVNLRIEFEQMAEQLEKAILMKITENDKTRDLHQRLENTKKESQMRAKALESQVKELKVLNINLREKDIQIQELHEGLKRKAEEIEEIIITQEILKQAHSDELGLLTNKLKSYDELIVRKDAELEAALEQNNLIKGLNESLENFVSERDQKIQSLNVERNSLQTENDSLKMRIADMTENATCLEQQLKEMDRERSSLKEEQVSLIKDITDKNKCLDEASRKEAEAAHKLQQSVDLEKKRFTELQAELDIAKCERQELKERCDHLESVSKEASEVASMNVELEKDLTDLKERVKKLSTENAELLRKQDALSTILSQKEKVEEKLKTELFLQENQVKHYQDRVQKLEEEVKKKGIVATPVANVNGGSVDVQVSNQNEIDFLNSVIVDQKHKLDELRAHLQMLERGISPSDAKELVAEGVIENRVAPRHYCDICEIFDAHETEDCPKQATDSPPPHPKHKPGHRTIPAERPFCEICEVFGHATADCDEEETF